MRAPFLLACLAATVAAAPPPPTEEAAIRADVAVLADDAMQGREAGTKAYDRAAAHVAARMRAAGLSPGADGGWYQRVPLTVSRATAPPALTLDRDGGVVPLTLGEDYVAAALPGRAGLSLAGRIVFAGEGIVDPATGRDDYRGLDVRDAIVLILATRPAGFAPDVAGHLGNPRQRALAAAAHGARAVVLLAGGDPAWQTPRFGRADRDEGAPIIAALTATGAARLFAGTPLSLAAIVGAAKAGAPIPTGTLPGTLRYTLAAHRHHVSSANVVGLLRGSDPALARDYVVVTAHLDHLGLVDAPAGADQIANGAQDNAVGVAIMLEAARQLTAQTPPPRRSILFVALTGEEKGLLGSDAFVARPPVPREALVADINLDMPLLLAPLRDIVVHGGPRSTLGPLAARAAASLGLPVVPDWEPEQGRFVRSDQYSFARAGIPAIALKAGPGGGSAERQRDFARTRYHTPADDLAHPIEWTAAAPFARVAAAIIRAVADAPDRPRWNAGDPFAPAPAPEITGGAAR